jgi:hypothetical protein
MTSNHRLAFAIYSLDVLDGPLSSPARLHFQRARPPFRRRCRRGCPLSDADFRVAIDRYCIYCHDSDAQEGQLDLDSIFTQDIAANSNKWEYVVRKIESRQMPPLDEDRPNDAEYEALTHYLVTRLDAAAAKQPSPGRVDTLRVQADTTQEKHVPGLPLGTRGGGLFRHTFPRAGRYDVQVGLTRDRNDEVEGLHGTHQMEILLDGKYMAGLTVKRPAGGKLANFDDSQLRARIEVPAGPHQLGVTFVRQGASLEETKRQPLNVHFNLHRHPPLTPAIYEVSITGPFGDNDKPTQAGDTPGRRRIFIAWPDADDDADAAAHKAAKSDTHTRLAPHRGKRRNAAGSNKVGMRWCFGWT